MYLKVTGKVFGRGSHTKLKSPCAPGFGGYDGGFPSVSSTELNDHPAGIVSLNPNADSFPLPVRLMLMLISSGAPGVYGPATVRVSENVSCAPAGLITARTVASVTRASIIFELMSNSPFQNIRFMLQFANAIPASAAGYAQSSTSAHDKPRNLLFHTYAESVSKTSVPTHQNHAESQHDEQHQAPRQRHALGPVHVVRVQSEHPGKAV